MYLPEQFAVDADFIALRHLGAERRGLPVAGDAAGLDPFVRLAPRADAGFADVLVEAHAGLFAQADRNAPISFANLFGAASNMSLT